MDAFINIQNRKDIYIPYVSEDGKTVLHGIITWGMGCGTPDSFSGVSTNVFKWMPFIKDVLVWTVILKIMKSTYLNVNFNFHKNKIKYQTCATNSCSRAPLWNHAKPHSLWDFYFIIWGLKQKLLNSRCVLYWRGMVLHLSIFYQSS